MNNKLIAKKTAISDLIHLRQGEIAYLEKQEITKDIAIKLVALLKDLAHLNALQEIL